MSNVVKHPAAALMDEVNAERAVAETPEAYELREAIDKAVYAYWKYLDRHGMFYDHGRELVRATALHVICDMCGTIDIMIKDGALNRRYGDGEDPDPFGTGLIPTWPPSKTPPSQS